MESGQGEASRPLVEKKMKSTNSTWMSFLFDFMSCKREKRKTDLIPNCLLKERSATFQIADLKKTLFKLLR